MCVGAAPSVGVGLRHGLRGDGERKARSEAVNRRRKCGRDASAGSASPVARDGLTRHTHLSRRGGGEG
eukprot:1065692-Prymnesium_polylepis.1